MFLIHTSLNIDGCLLFNCVCVCMCTLSHFSRIQLFATLWTAAHQASLSIRFSRQEYWSGFPCPPLEDLPDPGIKPTFPALQEDSLPSEPLGKSSASKAQHESSSLRGLSILLWVLVLPPCTSMVPLRQPDLLVSLLSAHLPSPWLLRELSFPGLMATPRSPGTALGNLWDQATVRHGSRPGLP